MSLSLILSMSMSIEAKWIHFLIVYQINKTLHIYFVSAKFSIVERSFKVWFDEDKYDKHLECFSIQVVLFL
jgi:hypothetical protein